MSVLLFDFVNVLYNPIDKQLNREVVEYIKELKERKIPLFLFTNVSSERLEIYDKRLDFLRYFKKVTCGDMYVKPDIRAYESLKELTGCDFEEMILVDDSYENIEVGRSLGIKGIQFVNIEDLRKELEKLIN
ncbi:MAG TPA: HAD-IA family hydrolase [Candidatus Dojkabacteria bacterium]|jgi:HAD superfamily hydrolase (TIGR01509 family)|nr:HAD-IA family hydrolase [Candidatus Dojkabacteria bacterium]